MSQVLLLGSASPLKELSCKAMRYSARFVDLSEVTTSESAPFSLTLFERKIPRLSCFDPLCLPLIQVEQRRQINTVYHVFHPLTDFKWKLSCEQGSTCQRRDKNNLTTCDIEEFQQPRYRWLSYDIQSSKQDRQTQQRPVEACLPSNNCSGARYAAS